MPNDFFKFKQFTIFQYKCAMKVTTIGCIQGAWLPDHFNPQHVLDIGAGTGLLTLMAAQKYEAVCDAVEIDEQACSQMKENFCNSPWRDRLSAHHADIRDFAKENSMKYDLIISNPPFYHNHLKSPGSRVNQARHQTTLDLRTLLGLMAEMISEEGLISILLPVRETEDIMRHTAAHSLQLRDQLLIADSSGKPPVAIVSILGKSEKKLRGETLYIKDANGDFTHAFKTLLRPYYLNI